jgi:cytidylate kinase
MAVITLSRQYGSKGLQLARGIAKRLGYRYVDRDTIETMGEKIGVTKAEAHAILEGHRGTIFDLIEKMSASILKGVSPTSDSHKVGQDSADFLDKAEDMLLWVAEDDNLVIVGCGGQKILKDVPHVVHVRVVASREERLANVMAREKCSRVSAGDLMDREEKAARRFMEKHWDLDREDPALYDVVLNMTSLGEESCIDMVDALIQTKVAKK